MTALEVFTCAFSRHARSDWNPDCDVFSHTGPELLPVQIKRKNARFFTAERLVHDVLQKNNR